MIYFFFITKKLCISNVYQALHISALRITVFRNFNPKPRIYPQVADRGLNNGCRPLTDLADMRRHDSARVVAPRVGCKSPRDRSPQSATVRSDTTKNHGAAFRPDIFQLHVNMIGGRRSCKSPPRRCSQCAHHATYVYTYTMYIHTHTCPHNAYAIERSDVRVRV